MTTALRTLLVDDEPIARSRLRALCAGIVGVEVVGEAADGVEALARITDDVPDVVLLDIAMPDLDGFEVARLTSTQARRPAIIFCTAYPSHALAAFEVEAVDYLLKPISRERLTRAIERSRLWREISISQPTAPQRSWIDHVWVPKAASMVRLELNTIEQIEAEGDYCRFIVGDVSYLLHESLNRLEVRLNPASFIRVRRSSIVRIDHIKLIENMGRGAWQILLCNGKRVRIGDIYLKAVKNRLQVR